MASNRAPWQLEFRDYAPDPERDQWTVRLGIKWALRLTPEDVILICDAVRGRNGTERRAIVRQVVCCPLGELPIYAVPHGLRTRTDNKLETGILLALLYRLEGGPVPLSAQVTCIRYRVQP